jgi:LemA protein
MKKGMMIVLGVVVLLLAFGGSCVSRYNEMVRMRERIEGNWAQVENVLQRRNDLIPNLVNTVKGYASHEKEVFENVAAARAKLAGATNVSEVVEANMAMQGALGRLLAIVENYPQLKADQTFIRLQDELAGAENRIAVERRNYNENVRAFNTYVKQFPNSLLARLFGFEAEDIYFEAEEGARAVPKVDFTGPATGAGEP